MDSSALASIKIHSIFEHAWRDILNHGSPYNHDAQGGEIGSGFLVLAKEMNIERGQSLSLCRP